jgi:serine protease AprX
MFRRAVLPVVVAALLLPLPALARTAAPAAPMDPWLVEQLPAASGALRVYVHADSVSPARTPAKQSGLRLVETFDKVGVAVADGPVAAIRRAARQPHVTYVEGDRPAEILLDRVHRATRNDQAQATITDAAGHELSGRGVSIAIIDTGVDGTHPFFRLPEGGSKVVQNLKSVCHSSVAVLAPETAGLDACWVPEPTNDSDTGSMGGHGTHVAGIAAGVPTDVTSSISSTQRRLAGAAPGASLVALSVGQLVSIYGGSSGLNWVLNHHTSPCGPGVSAAVCPPIRVTNNSWGPSGGSMYSPGGVVEKLQQALVKEGVVTVWAAGNDAGDGSGKDVAGRYAGTNGPGNDPTPGILMAASYDDNGSGNPDAQLSSFSSRGIKGKPETYPDLAAPGDRITSACRPYLEVCSEGFDPYDGPAGTDVMTFNTLSGTSMATPYVAGVVAELFQLDPTLTPGQVEIALENGAHQFTAGGPYETDPSNPGSLTSYDKGHGLIDVLASAQLVQAGGITVPMKPVAPPKPVPPPFVPPKGVVTCSTAFVDPKGDATDFFALEPAQRPNRPALDLRAGRYRWDGDTLTVAFVVDDVSAPPPVGSTGSYYSLTIAPSQGEPFRVIASRGTLEQSYLARGAGDTASLDDATAVDRPGTGNDEVQVTLTDAQLQALAGENPKLVAGLTLTTTEAYSSDEVATAPVIADQATPGSCSYVVGAADTPPAKPKAKPAKR